MVYWKRSSILMFRIDWSSFFMSGILAIVLSWAVTGCRFGNSVTTAKNKDQITGYYEMRAQKIDLFTKLENEPSAREGVHSPNKIPAPIGSVTSNPSVLVMENLDTGLGFIGHYIQSKRVDWLPILISPSFGVSTSGQGDRFTAWGDQKCVRQHFFQGSGSLNQEAARLIAAIQTRGRIEMDLTFYNTYTGQNSHSDCQASLASISQCYSDSTKCTGKSQQEKETQQRIQRLRFSPYIDAGIIDLSDLPNVEAMGYEVSYE